MPWIAVGVAGASLLGGLFGSSKERKMQRRQMAQEQEKLDFAKNQWQYGKDQYEKWEQRFDPLFMKMMNEMDQGITPNYGMIAGDVKSAFQAQRGSTARNLMRYGARPTDGAMAAADRDFGIREAGAHVGARALARENSRGILYNRLGNMTQMIGNMQGVPANMMNAGNAAVQNAMGDVADQYGQQGRQQNAATQNMAAGIGALGGALGGVDWNGIAQQTVASSYPTTLNAGLGNGGANWQSGNWAGIQDTFNPNMGYGYRGITGGG